jgi:hypothetical protein
VDRRLAGAVLVLLAIVGVTVAAVLPGRRMPGTAVMTAFPPPPTVGDCLIDPLDPITPFPAERQRQVPQYGPCAGHLTLGEVVEVHLPAPKGLVAGLDERAGCRRETLLRSGLREHAGAFQIPGGNDDEPVTWQYSIAAVTGWIGQIPWSPAASAWAACIARPIGLDRSVDSLTGSFSGGILPNEYGTCWKSKDVSAAMRTINCTLPHAAELIALGTAVDPGGVSWDRASSSCTDQARLTMNRADPTAGGTLRVTVDGSGAGSSDPVTDLTCFVTAADDRRLIGSLVGRGFAPPRFVP